MGEGRDDTTLGTYEEKLRASLKEDGSERKEKFQMYLIALMINSMCG